jgi:predicted phage tail protein
MGTSLYAGGWFTSAGGVTVNQIARWNGSAWSALGSGTDGAVNALAVMGTSLYAGGWFSTVNDTLTAQRIARWDA